MESIQNVLNVIKKKAFMVSIDLKDVFYSVPVAAHHQKYLNFFANEYLKFTCMPNEYGPTIFRTQDARPYLTCICRRFLLTRGLL